MSDLLLGIDVGTGSSKAVLATADGTVVATAEREHGLSFPRPGWVEQDAEQVWWGDVSALCRSVSVPRGDRIAALCVSTLGPCVVPCDAELHPLRPGILYGIDTRAGEQIAALERRYGREAIFERGGSHLSSQALGAKLRWLVEREPELWERTAGWYTASSYVVAKLTGEYVLDHHSASQCDPLYDLAAGRFDAAWAADVAPGVPLPCLAWPGEVVGALTDAAAAATGLAPGTAVLAGTIDAWAEAFSVGVRRPGELMLMYGSTMFLVQGVDGPRRHPGLWATVGVEPGSYTLAAGMATSGSLTGWLRELAGGPPFEALVEEARRTPPGADGVLLLPYFAGERSPIFDPDARGVVAGLTLAHGRGHLLRAVLEAVAFGVRHNLAAFAQAGTPIERAVVVGGGTRGGLWTQIVSDVTGLVQELPRETIGAAYGDARLAGIAIGATDPGSDWAVVERRVEPDPSTGKRYAELFELYRELDRSTRAVSHRLAALATEDRTTKEGARCMPDDGG